jgi:hypothetical protein
MIVGMFPALLLALPAPLPQDPASAPSPERGLRVNLPEAAPGFVLFAPLRSRTTFVIDGQGTVRHRWENQHPPLSVYLLDDGSLLRSNRVDDNPTFHGGGLGGRIQRLAKDGSVVWEFVLSDANNSLHHDIEPLPNGNVLAIAWELVPKEGAEALGRDPAATHAEGWWPCWVLEIRPTPPSGGDIVWEWHAKDHLVQDFDPEKPHFGSVPQHPGRIDVNADHRDTAPLTDAERLAQAEREAEMRALGYAGGDEDEEASSAPDGKEPPKSGDWLHLNSIDHDPTHDLILLSNPEMSEIWVIDHSTTTAEAKGSHGGRFGQGGELLYRWGNPRMYGLGAKEDQRLFYQHQAEWVAPGLPGAGHVTLFNNGSKRPVKEYSSIEELVLPFDPKQGFTREAGRPFRPETPVWSYSDPEHFFSFFISGCHRLPNGNTFVCSGKQGRFFEVTPAGAIVWEYWNPHGGEFEMGMGNAAPPPPGGGPPGGGNPVEPTSCFRATKLAPDHPGLRALGIVP